MNRLEWFGWPPTIDPVSAFAAVCLLRLGFGSCKAQREGRHACLTQHGRPCHNCRLQGAAWHVLENHNPPCSFRVSCGQLLFLVSHAVHLIAGGNKS